MFFKKTTTPLPAELPLTYAWKEADGKSQELWIAVHDWQYKVFPSRRAQAFGSWMFQFEGTCSTEPLKGLVVTGEVEVLDANETPGMLSDHWKEVPEDVEGYAFFMDSGDQSILPSIGVTLYCQASALDWVYRAFAMASQSRSGGLGIELRVDCPNNGEGPFWRDQWQQEWLRVSTWKLFAGAQLKLSQ